jgi:membrane protein required for colicin V production
MQVQTMPLEPAVGSTGLAWIDWLGLGLLALFLVLGAVRGLWWQVMRLAGLALAIAVARAFGPLLEPRVSSLLGPDFSPRVAYGLVWVTLFIAALAVAALLGHLGRRALEAMQLGLADRFWGALVGALTGVLMHVALLVVLVQLAPEPWLRETLTDTGSERVLLAVGRRWQLVLTHDAGREAEAVLVPPNRLNAPVVR